MLALSQMQRGCNDVAGLLDQAAKLEAAHVLLQVRSKQQTMSPLKSRPYAKR
jgi:hypothetical protein